MPLCLDTREHEGWGVSADMDGESERVWCEGCDAQASPEVESCWVGGERGRTVENALAAVGGLLRLLHLFLDEGTRDCSVERRTRVLASRLGEHLAPFDAH